MLVIKKTDLRKGRNFPWPRRKRLTRAELSDIALVEFLSDLARTRRFTPNDKNLTLISRLSSAAIERFSSPRSSSDNTAVNYCVAELKGKGYLLVSEHIPRKPGRYNFFYSNVFEGLVEALGRIRDNPANPDVSGLEYTSTIKPKRRR